MTVADHAGAFFAEQPRHHARWPIQDDEDQPLGVDNREQRAEREQEIADPA